MKTGQLHDDVVRSTIATRAVVLNICFMSDLSRVNYKKRGKNSVFNLIFLLLAINCQVGIRSWNIRSNVTKVRRDTWRDP